MKSKQKSSPKADHRTPPGPRRGGGRGELPPIPGESSLPPVPNQRPPPIPGSHPMAGGMGPDETYEDPTQSFGMPPPVPPPMASSMHYPEAEYSGMDPGMGIDSGMGMDPGMGIDPGPGIMEDIYGKNCKI